MFAKIVGTTTYYCIRDALGSTRQVWKSGQTSPTFSVTTYKPFGTPVSPSGTEKFEYAGEMIVSAAGTSPGLYYIGARWMDPELGRWLSMDVHHGNAQCPQSLNRCVYCLNNPLTNTDPSGEIAAIVLMIFAGYIVGALKYTEHWRATGERLDFNQMGRYMVYYGLLGAVAGGLKLLPKGNGGWIEKFLNTYFWPGVDSFLEDSPPGSYFGQTPQEWGHYWQYTPLGPSGVYFAPPGMEDRPTFWGQVVDFFTPDGSSGDLAPSERPRGRFAPGSVGIYDYSSGMEEFSPLALAFIEAASMVDQYVEMLPPTYGAGGGGRYYYK